MFNNNIKSTKPNLKEYKIKIVYGENKKEVCEVLLDRILRFLVNNNLFLSKDDDNPKT